MRDDIYSEYEKIIDSLLSKETFQLPFVMGPKAKSLKGSIEHRIKEYIQFFENYEEANSLVRKIKDDIMQLKEMRKCLGQVLDNYLVGKPGEAYKIFSNLLESNFFRRIIETLLVDVNKYVNHRDPESHRPDNCFYRARVSDKGISVVEEMFHIPFELRYLVENQRFSIAGVPCLYLGASIYDCWQEMGQPDLNKLFISRLKVNESRASTNVLDIAYSFEREKLSCSMVRSSLGERDAGNENVSDLINAKLVFWPIVMACSYIKAHPDGKFHSEYIIPNLLLQWIRMNKEHIAGIKYRSVKEGRANSLHLGDNFVFPPSATNVKFEGYCESLSQIFKISPPISWQLINTVNDSFAIRGSEFQFKEALIENNFIEQYKMTQFYLVEKMMQRIKTRNIENH